MAQATESFDEEEFEERAYTGGSSGPSRDISLDVSDENDFVISKMGDILDENPEMEEEEALEQAKSSQENDVNIAAVRQYLSENIYTGEHAFVRELISNAETSAKRAKRLEESRGNDYAPIIEVVYEQHEHRLIVRDNGLGCSTSKFENVVTELGTTDAIGEENASGRFGVGLTSVFMATGKRGAVAIKTKSRITDEEHGHHFTLANHTPMDGGMPSGQYGFEVTVPLKDDIDGDSIAEWVDKYAEYTEVTVLYSERDSSGEVTNEEYSPHSLDDGLERDPVLTVEDEHFRAVASPDTDRKTLLISMPIDRNDGRRRPNRYESPFKFAVRIRHERGVIVDCECPDSDHEGLIPVDDYEYDEMDGDRREEHVPESMVGSDDIRTPMPTNSRDSLQKSDGFWKYVSSRINDEFRELVEDVIADISSPQDVIDLSDERRSLLMRGIKHYSSGFRNFRKAVREEFSVDIDDETSKMLDLLDENVGLAPRGNTSATKSYSRRSKSVYEVLNLAEDGDVYMFVTASTSRKMRVAWDLDDENQVVCIDSSSYYQRYEDSFGWKKLKELPLAEHKLEELGVSEDVIDSVVRSKSGTGHTPASQITESETLAKPKGIEERSIHTCGLNGAGTLEDLVNLLEEPMEYDAPSVVAHIDRSRYGDIRHDDLVLDGETAVGIVSMPTEMAEYIDGYDRLIDYDTLVERSYDFQLWSPTMGEYISLREIRENKQDWSFMRFNSLMYEQLEGEEYDPSGVFEVFQEKNHNAPRSRDHVALVPPNNDGLLQPALEDMEKTVEVTRNRYSNLSSIQKRELDGWREAYVEFVADEFRPGLLIDSDAYRYNMDVDSAIMFGELLRRAEEAGVDAVEVMKTP